MTLSTADPAVTDVCSRNKHVKFEILVKLIGVEGVSTCGDVTAGHLAQITGTFSLTGSSTENVGVLSPSDFSG